MGSKVLRSWAANVLSADQYFPHTCLTLLALYSLAHKFIGVHHCKRGRKSNARFKPMANPALLALVAVILSGGAAYIHSQPLLSDDPITIDPIGCVTNANQQFCTSVAERTNATIGQSGAVDPDVVCPTASITDQNLTPEQVAAEVWCILLYCRLNFPTPTDHHLRQRCASQPRRICMPFPL